MPSVVVIAVTSDHEVVERLLELAWTRRIGVRIVV